MIKKENLRKLSVTLSMTFGLLLTWITFMFFGDAPAAFLCSMYWLTYLITTKYWIFESFVSTGSRGSYMITLLAGTACAARSAYLFENALARASMCLLLVAWIYFLGSYLIHYKNFDKVGCGYVPQGSWTSPPVEAFKPMMLFVAGGKVGPNVFGIPAVHGELVLQDPKDGSLWTFSDYMELGCRLFRVKDVVARFNKMNMEYWLLEWNEPVTQVMIDQAWQNAQTMLAQNREHAKAMNATIGAHIDKLAFCADTKKLAKWKKSMRCSGYYWRGLLDGSDSLYPEWTCISSATYLAHSVGLNISKYHGLGVFGAGTGILDPIVATHMFFDPNLKVLRRPDYSPRPNALAQASFMDKLLVGITGWPEELMRFSTTLGAVTTRMLMSARNMVK